MSATIFIKEVRNEYPLRLRLLTPCWRSCGAYRLVSGCTCWRRPSPELERELPATPIAIGFWRGVSMQALIEQQNVQPANDFDALLSGWPPDETVDDFIKAVHESRQQYLAEVEAE